MSHIDAGDARALALSLRRMYNAVAEKIEEELLRRVVLVAIRADQRVLRDEHFAAAPQAMSGAGQALTRALLGGRESESRPSNEPPYGEAPPPPPTVLDEQMPPGPKDTRMPARLHPPTC